MVVCGRPMLLGSVVKRGILLGVYPECTGVLYIHYTCVHTCTCNLLSTCMYVHTGTVHVVQERMDILPYMCVPYTQV